MGTVVSLDVPDPNAALVPWDDIEAVFSDADARFSLYRPDSELSQINAGRGKITDGSVQVRASYELASEWRIRTGGAFSPTRPDGVLDLNGVVKALAMRDAGALLADAGCQDWTLAVGGDLLTSGTRPGGGGWLTGIIDPAHRAELLCAVELRDGHRAVATSGSAERGDHIWNTGAAPTFVQVSVLAEDILTADVLATAIVAGGEPTLRDACARWAIDVLTVDAAGGLTATAGFRSLLASNG
ncbi:FAD:protein FMN transferase [Microbacterium sp. 1P10UB]|uniref:FAD:protein FMN transferase n=1 Tax=unclassified Microbacterium TaxID=2609290 RepID=UPI00399EEFB5